ncbi:MAG: hypothetical protein ACUVUR_04450, partial [bacterium]
MKRYLMFALLPVLASAGIITKTLFFNQEDFIITEANGFDVVHFRQGGSVVDEGKPALPLAVFNVVVPTTATVTKIEVIPIERE